MHLFSKEELVLPQRKQFILIIILAMVRGGTLKGVVHNVETTVSESYECHLFTAALLSLAMSPAAEPKPFKTGNPPHVWNRGR